MTLVNLAAGHCDSIADYLTAAAAPSVCDALISAAAGAAVARVAREFPGPLTDFFGFECTLDDDNTRADFLMCCKRRQGAHRILAGRNSGCDLPVRRLDEPVWQRVRAFATEWANPRSALVDAIHNMWFEFDIDTAGESPVPNVFIGSDRLRAGPVPAWLTEKALPLLLGTPVDAATVREISRCLQLLPGKSAVFQLGLMLARESRAARICVRGLEIGQIVPYLIALGWDGASDDLGRFLRTLEPDVRRIDLDLDVADRVQPRIGLECYVTADGSPPLLDTLVAAKLCSPKKAAALTDWPATVSARRTPEVWPRALLAAATLPHGLYDSAFVRALHHVKVDYANAAPTRAKAYLGIHHRWLPRDVP